jgi:hypothetical protein
MKDWILFVVTLFLLQAAALAAPSSFFDGDFEEVPDDDGGIETLYLVLNLLIYGVILTSQLLPRQRDPSVFEQRLMWADYVARHTKRNHDTFSRRLRMELESFNKLVELIREGVEVNQEMANLRGGPIIPELCLFCTIRWLAGGSYLDIVDITGISVPSFYRIVWKTCRAIINSPELRMKLPETSDECEKAASGFRSISYNDAIPNCVGVLDGYLLKINTPKKKEATNVRSYYSGHYQCSGVNIQAVADHHCRFTYLAVAAPGSTGDNDAMHQTSLAARIAALPLGYCIIADAAYTPTEHIVSIYAGIDRLNPRNDSFNFFASQCRIRIEMAFGLMQTKWGILRQPQSCSLANLKYQVHAIACLQNFVINERLGESIDEAPRTISYLPSEPQDEDGNPILIDGLSNLFPGWSELREQMAARIEKMSLTRPVGNRLSRDSI